MSALAARGPRAERCATEFRTVPQHGGSTPDYRGGMDQTEGVEQPWGCNRCQGITPHRRDAAGELRCLPCAARGIAPVTPAAPAPKGFVSTKRLVITGSLLALLIVVMGFTHIVHGKNVGLKVCEKAEWGLGDTFVDVDDYIGKSLLQNIDKAKVVGSLIRCGVLEMPDSWKR